MNQQLYTLILDCLEPTTLAYLVRDLEDLREDWQYYPEEVPSETLKQELDKVIAALKERGKVLTAADEAHFRHLIEAARNEQRANDWAEQRDQQERQNWLEDFR
jgi:hypothetical protein